MAGKNDKSSGVFTIICEDTQMVYVGKSTGVGVAKRSAKSKLKKGAFHNKALQDQYNLSPMSLRYGDLDLLEEEDEDFTLTEYLETIRNEWIDEGYIPYNDLEIITITKKEIETIDVMEDLVGKDKSTIERVIKLLNEGKIQAQALNDLLDSWGL